MREVVDSGDWQLIEPFSSKLEGHLREYYYVGGMPEVVQSYVRDADFGRTRDMQLEIAAAYESDMSKHLSSAEAEAAIAAWRSLPRHLAEENKRFIFGHVREGARARQFHGAVTWLVKAGLCCNRSVRVSGANRGRARPALLVSRELARGDRLPRPVRGQGLPHRGPGRGEPPREESCRLQRALRGRAPQAVLAVRLPRPGVDEQRPAVRDRQPS